MTNDTNSGNPAASVLVFIIVLAFVIWILPSCSSKHYFSIVADEISNPNIEYADSAHLYNPF